MGPKQLAGVMTIVAAQSAEASMGRSFDEEADAPCAMIEEQGERESLAMFATSGAVRRRHHRPARHPHRAGHVPFSAIDNQPSRAPRFGVFRM
jgi:hypothetical protein